MNYRITLLWIVLTLSVLFAAPTLTEGDRLYSQRAIEYAGNLQQVPTATIDKAIAHYTSLIKSQSGKYNVEATWKAMRSYYFKGFHCTPSKEDRITLYEKALELGSAALTENPDAVEIHIWSAILLGVWGQDIGILSAARNGVADRIREHCESAMKLDSTYYSGAAFRVLGRVHFMAPRIPLILPWPSKEESQRLLEIAYNQDKNNLYNALYLAETLHKNGEKERAVAILNRAKESSVESEGVVEDKYNKRVITDLLQSWN